MGGLSASFYVCPLCGHEFKWAGKKKTVKCGDHTLRVAESEGVLTVQVLRPQVAVLKGVE